MNPDQTAPLRLLVMEQSDLVHIVCNIGYQRAFAHDKADNNWLEKGK